jgi:GAF domain-containing protein
MDRSEKITRYRKALEELEYLLGVEGKYALDDIGKMATISTVLKMNLPYFFFVGFYRAMENRVLQIGPYQGDVLACGTIPYERGVCGACATKQETLIVPDVTKFPGYIACDDLTRSEIVVPVMRDGKLLAVLDVDSIELDDFDEVDQEFLERLMMAHFSPQADWYPPSPLDGFGE